MKNENNHNKYMEYADAIVVVDKEGKIVYSSRYNPRFDKRYHEYEFENLINKNVLEVYPHLDPGKSTIMNCLSNGTPLYIEGQTIKDYKGRIIVVNSLNIPIIRSGEIIGVVEISQDITRINDELSVKRENGNSSNKKLCREDMFLAAYTFNDIITSNVGMIMNIERAKMIANSTSSVLIYGETGTGKELFVESIHNYSTRQKEPFIAQNCAALPETLFESILFGSSKGAYTGSTDKPGLFELANNGTLFLDEINSMPISLQAKLLRVLQDGMIRRIGDTKDRKVDVRIIAAMNIEPLKAIGLGQLREDLFYRLNVVSIKLVPLRERKGDIPLYVEYFISKYNKKFNKHVTGISNVVEELFMNYNWPGNVREFQHVIEASINIIDKGNIEINHLPIYLNEKIDRTIDTAVNRGTLHHCSKESQSLKHTIESIEKSIIMETLEKNGGNITNAADMLEISRQSLHYKLKKYNINIGYEIL